MSILRDIISDRRVARGLPPLPAPRARPAVAATTTAIPKKSARLDCIHRGLERTRQAMCQTCVGVKMLNVFACAAFGECTIGRKVDDVAGCCKGCASYAAPTS